MTIDPNWSGSIPKSTATGSRIGVMIRRAEVGSRIMPIPIRTMLMTSRKTSGLSVSPVRPDATACGTCSLARIQLSSADAPMMIVICAVTIAVSRKISAMSRTVTVR